MNKIYPFVLIWIIIGISVVILTSTSGHQIVPHPTDGNAINNNIIYDNFEDIIWYGRWIMSENGAFILGVDNG